MKLPGNPPSFVFLGGQVLAGQPAHSLPCLTQPFVKAGVFDGNAKLVADSVQ